VTHGVRLRRPLGRAVSLSIAIALTVRQAAALAVDDDPTLLMHKTLPNKNCPPKTNFRQAQRASSAALCAQVDRNFESY
jgi:hypothetical protein